MCQGDCDRDSDCASGLRCFQRSGYTAVPGCTGSGSKDWDYCVDKKFLSSPDVNGKGIHQTYLGSNTGHYATGSNNTFYDFVGLNITFGIKFILEKSQYNKNA